MARQPTAKMLAHEARLGRPVPEVVIDGLARLGSIRDLARELGVPDATIRRWMLTFHIELEVLSTIRITMLTPTGAIHRDVAMPCTDLRRKGKYVGQADLHAGAQSQPVSREELLAAAS